MNITMYRTKFKNNFNVLKDGFSTANAKEKGFEFEGDVSRISNNSKMEKSANTRYNLLGMNEDSRGDIKESGIAALKSRLSQVREARVKSREGFITMNGGQRQHVDQVMDKSSIVL